ncbi:metallophosphoesterase [Aristophania vespae]|uniref:Metallophosphoesterase n=1 Tax=Aristophania vespae TaxID=2697033 RepID=A0A6P1NGD3_9PROT|nr:metallophosphoesterase [Aristophania vespae]QHI95590.1 metallophosphoesterase [Aristophania vespae]
MLTDSSASLPLPKQEASVRFAHISDPHLPLPNIPIGSFFNKRLFSLALWKGERQKQHLFEITQKIIANIKKQANIDSILISGDLTNFGTKQEFLSCSNWLQSLPIEPILVPGNHDAMMPENFDNSLSLWTKWTGPQFPFVRCIKNVAIIGLNSAVPTPLFKAYGRLDQSQIRKLSYLLEDLGQSGYCRIVMIHHPPHSKLMSNSKSLRETHEFSEVLRSKGAELVLHGHSHKATFTHVEGCNVPLLGTSSVSMKREDELHEASWNKIECTKIPDGWNLKLTRINIKGDSLWEHQWNTYNQTASSFQESC